jgi:thiamine biosynthesis protein ThiS
MPDLIINGTSTAFSADEFPTTVGELLEHLEISPQTVVAEVDGEVVGQGRFTERLLKPDSRVELVQFVGGG